MFFILFLRVIVVGLAFGSNWPSNWRPGFTLRSGFWSSGRLYGDATSRQVYLIRDALKNVRHKYETGNDA